MTGNSPSEQQDWGRTFSPEVRAVHARMIHLAAELVRGECLPDPDTLIRDKSTTVGDWGRVVRAINDIEESLKRYGIELRRLADELPKTERVRMPFP